jgi:hypothetical protein
MLSQSLLSTDLATHAQYRASSQGLESDTYRQSGPGPRLRPQVGDRGHRFCDADLPFPGSGDTKNLSLIICGMVAEAGYRCVAQRTRRSETVLTRCAGGMGDSAL